MYRLLRSRYIHRYIYAGVLYLSFCFNGFFGARGFLSLFGMGNDLLAFFLGGALPFLVYELFSHLLYRRVGRLFIIDGRDLRYDARAFLILANVAAGTVKLLYLAFPLLMAAGENLFAPILYILALFWFIVYASTVYFRLSEKGAAAGILGAWHLALIAVGVIIKLFFGYFV